MSSNPVPPPPPPPPAEAAAAAALIWFLGKSLFSHEKVIMVVAAGRSGAQSGCSGSEGTTAVTDEAVLQGEAVVAGGGGVPVSLNTGSGVTTAMWPPITEYI